MIRKGTVEKPNRDDRLFWSMALDLLSAGKCVTFASLGKSMAPFIRDGDSITVRPCSADEVRFGDVILYSMSVDGISRCMRVHRFIKRRDGDGKYVLLTKGDAAATLDAPVDRWQVLGKVVAIRKGRFTLDLNRPWGRAINLAFALFQRWPLSGRMMRTVWKGMKSLIR